MKERLQKVIAASGVASRRKAEQLIEQGLVTVNGHRIVELGFKADPSQDHIKVNGQRIKREPLEYYVVNKPSGVLSAVCDDSRRPVVTQLVRSRLRLYPAGRLDFQSEGLVILTNDGKLTRKITHSGGISKTYRVKVRGCPQDEQLTALRGGLTIGSQKLASCRIRILKKGRNCWYEVILREGKNRQIRRMFEQIGHPVMRLRRVAIGPVSLGELPPGASRRMSMKELCSLREA